MSHEICEVVKIKSEHPKSQGAFIEINKADFDPKKHTLYGGKDAPPAPSPVTPPPPAPIPAGTEDAPAPSPVNATDKAVELANDAGIDLASVVGTGKNGKVTAEDVEAAIEKLTAPEGAE